jgi:predicted nucleic acid-binding Zn ribbon protein
MRFEEHRFERVDERHVEIVDPVRRNVSRVAVAMPAPRRRQHDVARQHRDALAVDRGIRTRVAFDDQPQGVRRVAMRTRVFAG